MNSFKISKNISLLHGKNGASLNILNKKGVILFLKAFFLSCTSIITSRYSAVRALCYIPGVTRLFKNLPTSDLLAQLDRLGLSNIDSRPSSHLQCISSA